MEIFAQNSLNVQFSAFFFNSFFAFHQFCNTFVLDNVQSSKKITTMSEIESRVKAIIVEKFGVSESEVTSEANFTNDLSADSLDRVELIMEIEDEFGISIPEEQAEKISTVGDAVKYVEEKVAEK